MKTKTIKQTVWFKASPHAVYEALMDAKKHARFSGCPAKVSRKVGGSFSVYEGSLRGTNVALIKDRLIVQSWRCVMSGWPKDHNSTVVFDLQRSRKGTKLVFTHVGVPKRSYADISSGWNLYYWTPMKKLLEA